MNRYLTNLLVKPLALGAVTCASYSALERAVLLVDLPVKETSYAISYGLIATGLTLIFQVTKTFSKDQEIFRHFRENYRR